MSTKNISIAIAVMSTLALAYFVYDDIQLRKAIKNAGKRVVNGQLT